MTTYVRKSTQAIVFKVLQANEVTILSSGVYFSRRSSSAKLELRFLTCLRHIAGHDYFYALSELLDSARECIFILVWVIPHVYLPIL